MLQKNDYLIEFDGNNIISNPLTVSGFISKYNIPLQKITLDFIKDKGYLILIDKTLNTEMPALKPWERLLDYNYEVINENYVAKKFNVDLKSQTELENEFAIYQRFQIITASDKRWYYEISGINLPSLDANIDTSRESQSAIFSSYNALKEGIITNIIWKDKDNKFHNFNFDDIKYVYEKTIAHVNNCFLAEKNLYDRLISISDVNELINLRISEEYNLEYQTIIS